MSPRVLVAGGPALRRAELAASLDASFDVDIVQAEGPFDALRHLPNAEFGAILILLPSEAPEAPGMDLVRFLSSHARHGRTPIALIGGTDAEALAARGLGAHVLPADAGPESVRGLVQDLLGLG